MQNEIQKGLFIYFPMSSESGFFIATMHVCTSPIMSFFCGRVGAAKRQSSVGHINICSVFARKIKRILSSLMSRTDS